MSKYSALFTSVNMLLGIGPLILPMPFYNAGMFLSIFWMLIVTILSYSSAMFIAQSMFDLHQYIQNSLDKSSTSMTAPLLESQKQIQSYKKLQKICNEKHSLQLDHIQQFQILFGHKWGILPCIAISIYLLGTSVSKCIMTGKILSKAFQNVDYLNHFNFWVFMFFVSGAIFSFRSIDKTKVLQTTMMTLRMLNLTLFIFGAIYLISKNGIQQIAPPGKGLVNFSQFFSLFSNSVFALMFHHSIPCIINNLKSTSQIRFVLQNSFLIAGTMLILIPTTAVMAFGSQLGIDPSKLKYYNIDFQDKINFIYWLASFYVLLDIASFSVYIIVLRNNFLHIYDRNIDAKKVSKQTIVSSLVILSTILMISWIFQNHIQKVLHLTGGIFGIFIIFLMPLIQVHKARQKAQIQGNPQLYIPWLIQGKMKQDRSIHSIKLTQIQLKKIQQ